MLDFLGLRLGTKTSFQKLGQWLDMSVLIERLKCLTNGDYTAALLALQRKRWNTACKALLDSVGVNTDGNYLFCFYFLCQESVCLLFCE